MLIFNYANWSTWTNPQKVTFDPDNKLIWINSGQTSIDVQIDLYSNWKEWILTYDNAKYSAAFYTFGGDPTSATQTAPPYFFLINGWKVKVSNMSVVVQTNLYSDDGLSPFIIENAAVTNRTSDAQVVKSEIENRLSYGDKVYVDLNTSYYGTTYPNGTIAQPVNNMLDGIAIANLYNITKIYLRSNITINNDHNLVGFDLYGDKNNIVVMSDITLPVLEDTRFYDLTISGNFAGSNTSLINCSINNNTINNINGNIDRCEISGTILIDNDIVINNSYSSKAGVFPGVILDMNPTKITSASIRAYSGGVKVLNCNQVGDVSTIELIAGKITLDTTCTNGILDLRGVGYLINNASSGCTVITDGLVSNTTLILTDIYGEMTIVTGLTQQMSQDVTLMAIQVSGMTDSVNSLDDKVSFISGTTYEMNQNVLIMTSGFTEINSGFTEMSIAISGMTDSVNSLDDKVSFISGTTYEMNQNVLTMTTQVSGITDDISTMTDAINVMGNEINDMFIAVNNLDAQIKRILGLSQENFRITDQVYAADNTLLSATIKIYSNSSDCDADINPLETYSMTALYDTLGRLTNYKVRLN